MSENIVPCLQNDAHKIGAIVSWTDVWSPFVRRSPCSVIVGLRDVCFYQTDLRGNMVSTVFKYCFGKTSSCEVCRAPNYKHKFVHRSSPVCWAGIKKVFLKRLETYLSASQRGCHLDIGSLQRNCTPAATHRQARGP